MPTDWHHVSEGQIFRLIHNGLPEEKKGHGVNDLSQQSWSGSDADFALLYLAELLLRVSKHSLKIFSN